MEVDDNFIAFLEVQSFNDGRRQSNSETVAPFGYFHQMPKDIRLVDCISSSGSRQHTAVGSVLQPLVSPFDLLHTSHVAGALAPFNQAWRLLSGKEPPISSHTNGRDRPRTSYSLGVPRCRLCGARGGPLLFADTPTAGTSAAPITRRDRPLARPRSHPAGAVGKCHARCSL
jgi:hypothetical protein